MSGEVLTYADDQPFRERRVIMEKMGVLYRGIKNHFGGKVVVEVIDPRNFIVFFVLIIRQGIKNQLGWRQIIHSLTKGFHTIAVFVNGKLVSIGKVPELHEVLLFIEKEDEKMKR